MVNELYLAVCYRPAAGLAAGLFPRLLAHTQAAPARKWNSPMRLDSARNLVQQSVLARAVRAGVAGHIRIVAEMWYSSLLEFLGAVG